MEVYQFVELLGETFDVIGKVLIAYTALAVHHRFRHEHKVDERIFTAMRNERNWAFLGIALLILGYIFKFYARYVLA